MATRQKTIRFAFDLNTGSVASAAARDFTQRTIYIPETVVAFRSVLQVISFQTSNVSTAWTAILTGIQLAAVARQDTTVTVTDTSSGEQQSIPIVTDVTSYFTTNWTGTSMTCDARLTVTGPATTNATCEIWITYDYDDTASTHIKTVRIPIGGANAALTQSLAAIGPSGAVPALDSYLPEASKTYRDIYFELELNEQTVNSNATDPILETQLDSEGATSLMTIQDDLISSRWIKAIWRRTDMTTNATHTFNARSTQSTMGMTGLTVVLCVTYEFSPGSSTRIMNDVLIPITCNEMFLAGSSDDARSVFTKKFMIEEPGSITLKQSAFVGVGTDTQAVTLNVAAGDQSYRSYAWLDHVMCGMRPFLHRLDSAGGLGTGIEIARGENVFTLKMYRTGTAFLTYVANPTGWLHLNYESDKSSAGVGAHARTVIHSLLAFNNTRSQNQLTVSAKALVTLPESTYWVSDLALVAWLYPRAPASFGLFLEVLAKRALTEGPGAGWENVTGPVLCWVENENAHHEFRISMRHKFKQWAEDTNPDRLDLETARDWLLTNITASTGWSQILIAALTYHSISFTFSGAITGYAGDGSGIVVDIFRLDTMEKVAEAVSAGGGTYSATLYDDQLTYFAVARQDGTHVGRSDHASVTG